MPPPPAVAPPPPMDASFSSARTSPYMPQAKSTVEVAEGGSAGLPQAKKARLEVKPVETEVRLEAQANVVPTSQIAEGEKTDGPGLEETVPFSSDADVVSPAKQVEDPSSSKVPLAEDEFGYRLSESNDHDFEFFTTVRCRMLTTPKRVPAAYKRTLLNLTYEKLLASAADEKDSAKKDLDAVKEGKVLAEKERDLALAKVDGFEKDLRQAKKEKKWKRLKEQLGKVELENVELRKKVEAAAESSRVRDLALEDSRKAGEVVSFKLVVLKEQYDGIYAYHDDEVARLRRSRLDHVPAAKAQFVKMRDASEARLGKLKAYLDEEDGVREKFLCYNQMNGVFGTLERLKTKYAIDTPPIFVRHCRVKEAKFERWLGDRQKFSYEPSNFVLPSDLEISVPSEVSEPEDDMVENAERVIGQAGDDKAIEGAGQAGEGLEVAGQGGAGHDEHE
ncbi:unnamed protein product [Cochlearia groenlandica]